MSQNLKIGVFGAAGKMGRTIVRVIADTKGTSLGAAIEGPNNPTIGQDAGALAGVTPLGVAVKGESPGADAAAAWIDFSLPEVTVANADAAARAGVAFVAGTTGLSDAQKAKLAEAGQKIPVVFSPNMSIGVNVLLELVKRATVSLGTDYDIDIVEAHHRMKRDAPSGTALRLAEAVAEGRERPLSEIACYSRHGEIGARPPGELGIQTLRGGDVVGDHTVFFFGQGERIEITHRASSRETFARGAVRAAIWAAGRAPGLYDMRDVLGLR
ncbi:MAG: 4-hydroxy-tetrahydrodipicolinate reductase [Deltaproteobacteria bacterium]|nr:4-hydroxy-tetrahydrodipicolinate reductase [Deltaproteobacteria bacterium]